MRNKKLITPVDMVTELMAGIIMALTVSASLYTVADGRVSAHMIATATIGCNLAWAIFDGLFYVFNARASQSHKRQVIASLRAAPDAEEFARRLQAALQAPISLVRQCVNMSELRVWLAHDEWQAQHNESSRSEDWLGGLAIEAVEVASAIPVILPLIVIADPRVAIRVAGVIAIVMMSLSGIQVARWNGQSIWLLGIGTPLIGVMLIAVCLILGG